MSNDDGITEELTSDKKKLNKTSDDYAVETFDAIPIKSQKKYEFVPPDPVKEKKDKSEKKENASAEGGKIERIAQRLSESRILRATERREAAARGEEQEYEYVPFFTKGVIARLIAIAVLIIGAIFSLIYFKGMASPGFNADSKMKLIHSNGVYTLSWDISKTGRVDKFIVEVYDGAKLQPIEIDLQENSDKLIYSADYLKADLGNEALDAEVTLPGNTIKGKKAIIYVNTEKTIKILGKEIVKRGRFPLIGKVAVDEASDYGLRPLIDTDANKLSFSAAKGGAETYSLFVKSDGTSLNSGTDALDAGTEKLLTEATINMDKVEADVAFGTDGLQLPWYDEVYTFSLVGETLSGPLTFIDMDYKPVSLDREDFLTDRIAVNVSDDGKNRYSFTWNETKGNGYTISVWDEKAKNWSVLRSYGIYEDRSFKTDKLSPCADVKYLVEAVLVQGMSETASKQEIDIHTNPSIEYATIWPTMDLTVYKNSTGEDQIGTVGALHAMTVLDEQDGRFYVRTGMGDTAGEGYIEADKCLVNLPDYIGDLCKYDIANSYASILKAHDYSIPAVSGTVVQGYENVLLSNGKFLVPVLYPVAKKLVPAAEKAREQGYILKIYDAFRPGVATKSIYSLTYSALDYVVPNEEFSRLSLKDYRDGKKASVLSLSSLKKGVKTEKTTEKKSKKKKKKSKKKAEETTTVVVVDDNTYSNYMLKKGSYSLGDFLEADNSSYNYGMALDVTLVSIETGKEIKMQTKVHDVTYRSLQSKNTDEANKLMELMTSQGFTASANEWWHFTDESLKDKGAVSVENGVSVEGWKKNDHGWRYRKANGKYYKDKTVKIGEKSFTFDKDGYADIN